MFGTWDIESFDLGGKFDIVGWYDSIGGYQYSYDLQDFYDYLGKSRVKHWFAHNSGKYDNLYLMDFLDKIKKKYRIQHINASTLFSIKRNQNRINFKDSFLFLPTSQERLTKSFGVKHIKQDYTDYKHHRNREKLKEYLRYDVMGLYELIQTFDQMLFELVKYRLDFKRKNTLASVSFDILLNKFGVKRYVRNYYDKETEKWIRKGYYGGRTEVFKRYGVDLYDYDVNSLYPYAMLGHMPVGRFNKVEKPSLIEKLFYNGKLGIVECKVKAPYMDIPFLPHRAESGKLMFPVGEWQGIYTTPEIHKAMSLGYEFDFIKGIFWAGFKKIFEGFVKKFYDLKQHSTGAKRQVAKLILNSSYGKFAQRREYNEYVSEEDAINRELEIWMLPFKRGYYVTKTESYRNRYINPIYSIFITAYSRIVLYEYMERIGFDHVFYCDTDSIFTDKKLHPAFIGEEIGQMKLENTVSEAWFIAPKTYALAHHVEPKSFPVKTITQKFKGIDRATLNKMSFSLFKWLSEGYETSVKLRRMLSFKQALTYKMMEGKGLVGVTTLNKKVSGKYDKRNIIRNDKTTPLVIRE